jgi:ADP-ribose pyrophosphatase YjhB (NUDIX family)
MTTADCRIHKLIADVAILAEHGVILARYRDVRRYDGQRGWFLPDDYLAHGEHPIDAARRIAREQLGVELDGPRLAFVESFDGEGTAWHLTFHVVDTPAVRPTIVPGENVAAAEWFALSALPDAADVAHEGWALDVLAKVQAEAGVLG